MEAYLAEFNHSDYSHYNDSLEEPFTEPDEYVRELWNGILLRYGDECVISVNSAKKIRKEFYSFVRQFTAILNETYNRYTLILKTYKEQEENLMKRLGSSSKTTTDGKRETRFNDTPQTTWDHTSEVFTGDEYMSTYTKNNDEAESETTHEYDPSTVMTRINEIERAYNDILKLWINEFGKLFWVHG